MSTRVRYVDAGDIDLDEKVVLDSRGERITEARAEKWAVEAIRELDEKRGRPPITGRQAHSPRVSVRVPDSIRDQVEEQAKAEGVTVSALARHALGGVPDRSPARLTCAPVRKGE